MILHQIEALAKAGVTDIVLAVNYQPEVMVSVLKKVSKLSSTLDPPTPPSVQIARSATLY